MGSGSSLAISESRRHLRSIESGSSSSYRVQPPPPQQTVVVEEEERKKNAAGGEDNGRRRDGNDDNGTPVEEIPQKYSLHWDRKSNGRIIIGEEGWLLDDGEEEGYASFALADDAGSTVISRIASGDFNVEERDDDDDEEEEEEEVSVVDTDGNVLATREGGASRMVKRGGGGLAVLARLSLKEEGEDAMLSELLACVWLTQRTHAHVLGVFALGLQQDNDLAIIADSLLGAEPLHAFVNDGRGDLYSGGARAQVVGRIGLLVLQLAEALDHCHKHGVLHQNVHPRESILVTRRVGVLKLTGFGFASCSGRPDINAKKDAEEEEEEEPLLPSSPRIVLRGTLRGWCPHYASGETRSITARWSKMAPPRRREFLEENLVCDRDTDIWSFALIVFELFACSSDLPLWPRGRGDLGRNALLHYKQRHKLDGDALTPDEVHRWWVERCKDGDRGGLYGMPAELHELIRRKKIAGSDILGCVRTRKFPQEWGLTSRRDERRLLRAVREHFEIWPMPEATHCALGACLAEDPSRRPSMSAVLEDSIRGRQCKNPVALEWRRPAHVTPPPPTTNDEQFSSFKVLSSLLLRRVSSMAITDGRARHRSTELLETTVSCCRAASALRPNDPAALCELGSALVANGRLSDAVLCFHRSLHIGSPIKSSAACSSRLGEMLRRNNNLDDALKQYHTVKSPALVADDTAGEERRPTTTGGGEAPRMVENPNRPSTCAAAIETHEILQLGEELRERHGLITVHASVADMLTVTKIDRPLVVTETVVDRALQLRESLEAPNALVELANTQRETGALDDAILTYRRALNEKPNDARVLGDLGTALQEAGQVGESFGAYHRAQRARQDASNEILVKANTAAAESMDRAIEVYVEALKSSPDDTSTLVNIAWAHSSAGRGEEAIEWLSHAASDGNKAGSAVVSFCQYDPGFATARRHPHFPRVIQQLAR